VKSIFAKVLGWGQFVLALLQQASSGHFPQNKTEWLQLISSAILAGAVHHASSTDGTK
jgi:hypothetical protein